VTYLNLRESADGRSNGRGDAEVHFSLGALGGLVYQRFDDG
jgi:hypothetical protein